MGPGPAHTLISDSQLWNLERTRFCCCEPPNLWPFVLEPQGAHTDTMNQRASVPV